MDRLELTPARIDTMLDAEQNLESLMRGADARMYQMKHRGRNGIALPEAWDAAAPAETRTAY